MEPHAFSIAKVREAGAIALAAQKRGVESFAKGGNPRDIVTDADLAISEFLTSEIKTNFPDHAVYSEESSDARKEARFTWTIDPIDGSANFSRSIPHFSICLGLLADGVPVAGAVYNPKTDELFSFEKGSGAFLNEEPIHVSTITELSQGTVFLHGGRKKENWDWGGASYRKLLEHTLKVKNFGSSSLDICFIASGRIEACVSGAFSTLDIVPAFGILKEAGGVACNAAGSPLTYSKSTQRVFIANSQEVLDQLRALLAS